ncbi:MAG TPA: PDZ domain-containing protein [Candidatus Polarisedimenticolaceae bacterium]|nr:PDZ domain-containing protein [Candidatus Polarisedimenticolaceae bacterium]
MRVLLRLMASLVLLLAVIPPARAVSPTTGWLGLRLAEQTGSSADGSGVLVQGIVEGSPADESHFRAKDTILAVDGTSVASPGELMARIRGLEPGSFVTFSVRRGTDDFEVRSVLGTRPEHVRLVRGWLGVEAIELPASLREHFGAPQDAGILVSAVAEQSPAYDAGIRVGDVVYEADGQPVGSLQELSKIASEAGIDNVMDVVLARDGARIVVGPKIQRAPTD